MEGARYKSNSTLDQVGMELGSELDPKNFSIFGLLGQNGISHKVVP
jgi:hypothetical protein